MMKSASTCDVLASESPEGEELFALGDTRSLELKEADSELDSIRLYPMTRT